MAYCSTDEVREVGVAITETSKPIEWTDEVLDKVIERASRIFDHQCNVEPGYFDETSGTATTRTIYGDGTNFLRLPPYVAGTLSTTLSYPSGYEAQEFAERGGYLVRTEGTILNPGPLGGWYPNVPIIVSAKWGYVATPADVKHAVIELVINLVKETDPASIKLMNLDNQPLREKLPPRVEMIAKRYRYREAVLV